MRVSPAKLMRILTAALLLAALARCAGPPPAASPRRVRGAPSVGQALRTRALRRSHHVLQPRSGLQHVSATRVRDPRGRPRGNGVGGRRLRVQLTREARCAHTRCEARLSPFTRTLLALCAIAAPALGGVLPE